MRKCLKYYLSDGANVCVCVCVCVSKLFESAKYKALKDAKKLVFPCIVLISFLYIIGCFTLANP